MLHKTRALKFFSAVTATWELPPDNLLPQGMHGVASEIWKTKCNKGFGDPGLPLRKLGHFFQFLVTRGLWAQAHIACVVPSRNSFLFVSWQSSRRTGGRCYVIWYASKRGITMIFAYMLPQYDVRLPYPAILWPLVCYCVLVKTQTNKSGL